MLSLILIWFLPKTSYACMAETMILALEGRFENYSLGRDLTVSQVKEIARLGENMVSNWQGCAVLSMRSQQKI